MGGGGEECSRVPRLSAVGLFAAGESHCRARAASCSGLGGAPCAAACERGPEAGNLGLPWRSSLGLGGRKGGQILGPEETLIAQFHCCLPWPYLALKAPPCPPGVGSKASPSPPPPPRPDPGRHRLAVPGQDLSAPRTVQVSLSAVSPGPSLNTGLAEPRPLLVLRCLGTWLGSGQNLTKHLPRDLL